MRMNAKFFLVELIACETSVEDILDLIGKNRVEELRGTVNTKYRDYAAEDIIEKLAAQGINSKKPAHYEDDEASLITVEMFVDEPDFERVEKWLDDSKAYVQNICCVEKGSELFVQTQDGVLNVEFSCNVIGFKDNYIVVEDYDMDVFDVSPEDIISFD